MRDPAITKTIRPLIKWTGGKYEESSKCATYIPPSDQYSETSCGGGGVFFALQPQGNNFINDRSTDLITFYRSLTNVTFREEIYKMLQAWEEIHLLNQDFTTFIRQDFDHFLYHNTPEHTIN